MPGPNVPSQNKSRKRSDSPEWSGSGQDEDEEEEKKCGSADGDQTPKVLLMQKVRYNKEKEDVNPE